MIDHDEKQVQNSKPLEAQRLALTLLSERCPRLTHLCYWAGRTAIALEELHHRLSFDLDFHTQKALLNVRPIMSEIIHAFPGAFEILQSPDEFGSGFCGILRLPGGEQVTIEVLSNYEDVRDEDLVPSTTVSALRRVSLSRYLADKIQCIAERAEARDLVDILAVLQKHPEMEQQARRYLQEQDALLLAERLLAWTKERIADDLSAYDDALEEDAIKARDKLLDWLKMYADEDVTE